MPCWQRRTQSVAVSAMDVSVLSAALTADGWTVQEHAHRIYARHGNGAALELAHGSEVLRVRGNVDATDVAGQVKRAYTRQAFKVAAKRFGFSVATNRTGRTVATRRRFSR